MTDLVGAAHAGADPAQARGNGHTVPGVAGEKEGEAVTVQLFLGDCLDIMPTLPQVDAIITDLPYGTTACAWDEIIPFEPMWAAVKRILKPRGVFVTTASQPFTSKLVMSNLDWFRFEYIWDKYLPSGFLDANRKPLKVHENICVFSDGEYIYNPQKTKGKRNHSKGNGYSTKNSIYGSYEIAKGSDSHGDMKYPQSIIEFDKPHPSVITHPTEKSVELFSYLILTYTNPGDTVLDICAGSGTTGVAAILTGRNAILIEKDPDYYRVMEKRIHDAEQQMRLPFD